MFNICCVYRTVCYLLVLPKLAVRYMKRQPVYINEPTPNTPRNLIV